jgi:hypothetical protein
MENYKLITKDDWWEEIISKLDDGHEHGGDYYEPYKYDAKQIKEIIWLILWKDTRALNKYVEYLLSLNL